MLIPPLPLLNFFVATVMLSIGLRVSGGELLGILRDRALFVRTLLANCVLIPVIGFLLVRIFPLTPDASVGILLLAAIPGTPIALQFTRRAKTRLAFAAAMTFVLSLVSLAMTPLAIQVMPHTAQRSDRPLVMLVMNIVLYIGLPLCAGLWAARRAPKLAPKLVLPLGVLATIVFVFLMWETRLVRRHAFDAIRGRGTVLAMLLLLFLSMLIGWMIGGSRPRVTPGVGDLDQHAQRDCRAVCGAVLLSGNQRLHGPDCLFVADGAHQPAVPSGLHWLAQMATGDDGVKTTATIVCDVFSIRD